jgi:DNA polymerase I
MPLFHTVLKMGLRGARADLSFRDRLQKLLPYLIKRRERHSRSCLGLSEGFNLNSNPQLKKLLYEEWMLPRQFNRKTRALSVDDDALLRLAKLSPQPMLTFPTSLRSLLEVRDARKKKSTYADVKVGWGGRLRTSYSVTGTETGRLSSKRDLFDQGWNSQNAPRWFRRIILPEKGEVLIEADLKFAEALIIAWKAGDTATIEAVRSGADIYRWHGQRMFEIPMDQIDKNTRDMIKPIILGKGYGLGRNHMFEMISNKEVTTPDGRIVLVPTGITRKRSDELGEMFFKSCPAIGEYQEWVRKTLRETRTIINGFGRRRTFLGRLNEEMFRKGYAYYPQGTCVDYLNHGLVRVEERLPGKLRLQIHDSMVLSVPKGEVEACRKVVTEALAIPVLINNEYLTIPVEVKVGENWRDMKEMGVFNSFEKEVT